MAGYSTPYAYANYLGEWVNDAAALVEIQAREWDHLGDGTGTPRNGMSYYDTTLHAVKYYIGGAWIMIGLAGAASLDVAYDGGGAGLGRIVTVDAGDVEWNLSGTNSFVVDASLCTGVADGFMVNDGTDYFHVIHAAANTLNLDAVLAAGTLNFSGAFDLDSVGALSLNSSGGAINIGNDADAQSINIGTGAAARTVSLGNSIGASQTDIRSGTGGLHLIDGVAQLNMDGAGALSETLLASADITPSGALTLRGGGVSQFGDDTGYFAFDGAGALSSSGVTTINLDCSGALSINSSGGQIDIGHDAVAQPINIGTGASARTITVGNLANSTEVEINALLVDINAGATGLTIDSGADISVTAAAKTLFTNNSNATMYMSTEGAVGLGFDPTGGPGVGPGTLMIGDPTSIVALPYALALADASTTPGYIPIVLNNGNLEINNVAGSTAKNIDIYDGNVPTQLFRLGSSGRMYVSDGDAATPSYSFLNGVTSGMFWNSLNSRIEWATGTATRMYLSNAGFDVNITAGGVSLDCNAASNFTVSGATADLTLGARGDTITLNEADSGVLERTALDGFTATSVIGALNELHSNIQEIHTLAAATLSFNDTSVTSIHVSYTATGAVTITVDSDQIAIAGRTFCVKDTGWNAAANTITIQTEGAEKIENDLNPFIINVDGGWVMLQSDGTDLFVIG